MKKIIIMAAGAVVLLGSCNNGGAPLKQKSIRFPMRWDLPTHVA